MISIGEASGLLGVHIDTLRQWDKDGKFSPVKTFGNHRRYLVADVQRLQGTFVEDRRPTSTVAIYSRVSSHEQKTKGDLGRQNERLHAYCAIKRYAVVKSYEEVGSGMCDTRPKLLQLFKLVESGDIKKVIVEHKDRLTRFSFNYLAKYFASHGVEIEFVEEVLGKSFEQELVADMLTLMSSFSAKLYGRRSAGRKGSRIQDRATSEQSADHGVAEERGGGTHGVELGIGSKEAGTPEQRTSANCERPPSPPESLEEDRLSVGIRSQQVCVSGGAAQSGSGIQQLLEEPQRITQRQASRLPSVQSEESRFGIVPADREHPCVREQHPTSEIGHSTPQGERLSASERKDTERYDQPEGGSLVRICPS